MSYRNGFEDAVELCIAETEQSETKEVAISRMKEFIELVKTDKLYRLKEMLWQIKK
jgi:hypothetical protein